MSSPDTWDELIDQHARRYPRWQVQDVYKLLYQALLGPAHAVTSRADFGRRLRDELERVVADERALLWEPIRPDGRLGRVHLRRFKADAGDPAALIKACLDTAEECWGAPSELRAAWAQFVAGCYAGRWAHAPSQVREFSAWLEASGYPDVHHSEVYRAAYSPAYRLVGRRWCTVVGDDGHGL